MSEATRATAREAPTARAPESAREARAIGGAELGNLAIPHALRGGAAIAAAGPPMGNQDEQRRSLARGIEGAKPALASTSQRPPHFDQIQASFGRHDVSAVRTVTGAAHESAHVVQPVDNLDRASTRRQASSPVAIQRSPDGGAPAAPSAAAVHAATNDRSPGQPLAAAVGGDLAGRVTARGTAVAIADARVHTDAHANVLARGLGARAFTRGADIYFAHGRFQPEIPEGRGLITHELVHVAQNARGGPTRDGVSEATDPSEREADAASRSLSRGGDRAIVTAGPSAALSRDQDGDLSTRVAAFKRLVLTTAQHRLLDNRENLAQWRTYLEDKIPLDEFKRELVATETVQAIATLGPYAEEYFTTENPSMQQYLGTIAAGDACPSCHGFMRAGEDKRRTTTIAERLIQYGGDETGLPPVHRASPNMFVGNRRQDAVIAAYLRSVSGGSGGSTAQPDPAFPSQGLSFIEDRAPLTIDQRADLMKRMYKTIAKLKPILGVLGPDGFKVLPTLIGISERIDQTPEQIMAVRQSVIDAIETRRQQYLDLYYQIDNGDIEWMHFGPILQDLLPIADADVQVQIKDEFAAWQRMQTLKAIFTLGVTVLLLLLAIFPPTSPLGVAALAAFEVGWGMHMIQEGQAQWRLGSAYSNAVGATNVLTKEQAEAGGGMMFMGALTVVAGVFTGAGGFARAAGIPNMPLSAFAPRVTPTLVAGARTLQFGEFTMSVEANGTIVVTNASMPDMLVIIRNGEAQLFQSMGPGGMRLLETRPFPIGEVGPEALGPYQTGALVPYQEPGALIPYQQPGPPIPYQQPGALIPYQQPSPLILYQQPGALVPFGQSPFAPIAPTGPFLLGAPRPPYLLGPGSWVPPTWNPSPEFNALAPYQLPPVSSPNVPAVWVRRPDGTWALEFAHGAGAGSNVIMWGSGPGASFVIQVPDQSVTALVTPRTGGTFQGTRSYPMQPVDMTDPATNVVGARSHLVPHADTPSGPVLSTAQPEDYVDHLSRIYNERIRRTLEQRFRSAGHQWAAYNVMSTSPRLSTGGFPIPDAEIIIELGPQGSIRAWRFPNDPAVYQSLPADFDSAIAPFELPQNQIPTTPVR